MKRRIINVYTLEVFESMGEAARRYGVSRVSIHDSVNVGFKIKDQILAYFEEWLHWKPEDKEKYSRRNNIYFM